METSKTDPNESLWKDAFALLDEDTRKNLQGTHAKEPKLLESVAEVAKTQHEDSVRRQWKIKTPKGREISIRTVLNGLLQWVQNFIAIVDKLIPFDPTGHAALPWAAVKFLLTTGVKDLELYGVISEGLEKVTGLIKQYALIDEVYGNKSTSLKTDIQTSVTALYAGILNFLSRAVKYFKTNPLKRSLASYFEEDIGTAMANLVSRNDWIRAMLSLSDAERSHHIERANRQVAVANWLTTISHSRQYEAMANTLVKGTGQWLIDRAQFRGWETRSESAGFLLHGLPGSGKSALATTVIRHTKAASTSAKSSRVAYFYFSRTSDEKQRDGHEALRSLAKQLCIGKDGDADFIDPQLEGLYDEYSAKAHRESDDHAQPLSFEACVRLIKNAADQTSVLLVVDAVDECEIARQDLVSALSQISDSFLGVIKVFLTSRTNEEILDQFKNYEMLQLGEDLTRQDTRSFAEAQIREVIQDHRLLDGKVSKQLSSDLLRFLKDHARGNFLWIRLQVSAMCSRNLESDIRSAMQSTTTETLNDLYQQAWVRIDGMSPNARTAAVNAFLWVLYSHEPLPSSGILVLASPNQHDKVNLMALQSLCQNMIYEDPVGGHFCFAHSSVQEFLSAKAELAVWNGHALIAKKSISVNQVGPDVVPVEVRDRIRRYSLLYWAAHAQRALEEGDGAMNAEVQAFVFEEGDLSLSFSGWLEDVSAEYPKLGYSHRMKKAIGACRSDSETPLFTACIFQFSSILKALHESMDLDWDQRNEDGQTALYIAAATGFVEGVDLLLSEKANPNTQGGTYVTPLQAACFNGNDTIVQALLKANADPTVCSDLGDALQAALKGGHEPVVISLLRNGFVIRSQDHYNAITEEIWFNGFQEAERVLNEATQHKYVTHQDTGPMSRRVLLAASKGRKADVERALGRGGIEEPAVRDAFDGAISSGQNEVASLIAARPGKDAYFVSEGPHGTALRLACLSGYIDTVRLVLRAYKTPEDTNFVGQYGDALQAAALRGYADIADILLSAGANPNNVQGGKFGSAMQAAAFSGHTSVVKILLREGAKVDAPGPYTDALHAASVGGKTATVQYLIDRGYRAKEETSIKRPAYKAPPSIDFKAMYRPDSDVNSSVKRAGATAAQLKQEATGRLRDTKREKEDSSAPPKPAWHEQAYMIDGATTADEDFGLSPPEPGDVNEALLAAAVQGDSQMVSVIHSQRKRIGLGREQVGRAIIAAADHGHAIIVDELLQGFVEDQANDKKSFQIYVKHWSIGHITTDWSLFIFSARRAAKYDRLEVIKMLWARTEVQKFPRGVDSVFEGALIDACYAGSLSVVKWLLSRPEMSGAAEFVYQHFALCGAIRGRQDKVVKLILEMSSAPAELLTWALDEKRHQNEPVSILVAAVHGTATTMSAILQHWPAPAFSDVFEQAIMKARQRRQLDLIILLVEYFECQYKGIAKVRKAADALTKAKAAFAETFTKEFV